MFENEVKYWVLKAVLKSKFLQGQLKKEDYIMQVDGLQDRLKPKFIDLEALDLEVTLYMGGIHKWKVRPLKLSCL